MSFGLFEEATARDLSQNDRSRTAQARFSQAYATAAAKVTPFVFAASTVKDVVDRLTLVRNDLREASNSVLPETLVNPGVRSIEAQLLVDFVKTSDCWEADKEFQKFLVDLYGTTDVTQAEVVEALEAYAGIDTPSIVDVTAEGPQDPTPELDVVLPADGTPEIEHLSYLDEDEGAYGDPFELGEYLNFCDEYDFDPRDEDSLVDFHHSYPDISMEPIEKWVEKNASALNFQTYESYCREAGLPMTRKSKKKFLLEARKEGFSIPESLLNDFRFHEYARREASDTKSEILSRYSAGRRRLASRWTRDAALEAYVASTPGDFTCECGERLAMPGYRHCRCGRVWNGYSIRTASSPALYVVREVPVRDVILASRS